MCITVVYQDIKTAPEPFIQVTYTLITLLKIQFFFFSKIASSVFDSLKGATSLLYSILIYLEWIIRQQCD